MHAPSSSPADFLNGARASARLNSRNPSALFAATTQKLRALLSSSFPKFPVFPIEEAHTHFRVRNRVGELTEHPGARLEAQIQRLFINCTALENPTTSRNSPNSSTSPNPTYPTYPEKKAHTFRERKPAIPPNLRLRKSATGQTLSPLANPQPMIAREITCSGRKPANTVKSNSQ